jgi:protein-S-isoprenylcysteine O-methyltransferase Ste14
MKRISERAIEFFYRAATGPRKMRMLLTPLAALFIVCVILLVIALSFRMDRIFGFPEFVSMPYGALISLPFLVGGALLWLWSVRRFLETKGTPVPVNPPPVLVTDGPYAYSRNPMMTGVFLILAGIGILFGSVFLTFIGTPVFVLISILAFKHIEEPELEMRFGRAYTEYKKKTPIIVPRFFWK